ncbi:MULTISPECIES: helix-turn-helix domain-containing protein [unclassified Streptomyces]|uniref:helix-turn-helix domain-containing protein n=1 Tax=unclassified Streptomyces TaxID=2593676 RepID=UPI003D940DA0
MSTDDRVQSVRNAWTNALRAEVLRVGRTIPEVARAAAVGMWIATYTDADGSNAFPARDTLATLSGRSQETVTRAVKVLMGVGLLTRKRRSNASTVYQLLIPTGRPDWAAHIHHMTDTRQRRARQLEKERLVAALTRTASADAFRTASAAGVYQVPPTYGRDPLPEHDSADHSPKPQTHAGEAAKDDESSRGEGPADTAPAEQPAAAPAFGRCRECHIPLIRPVRDLCHGCERAHTDHERHSAWPHTTASWPSSGPPAHSATLCRLNRHHPNRCTTSPDGHPTSKPNTAPTSNTPSTGGTGTTTPDTSAS